ncbi:MAG TPA: UDP-glucose 4-epimerase GalE [Caulobacteraceae bacterium]|nr:UDP-glucose 4-epimerase GalE [Caulobacteraceae bacterium]
MTDTPAILVAGGAGYIGSQTCKALRAAGFMPVTLDNLSTGYRQAVKFGPFVEADLRDRETVQDTVREHGVVAAIHFAAFSLVGESVKDPAKYYDNNVGAANAFASALIGAGVQSFLFSSTAATYGIPSASPIPEDHPTVPINPYGASKLAFEGALRWLGEAHDFRWTALRYFNAAGADLDGEVGESHEPETHLIPNLCKAVYGTGPALTVFGQDYPTPDGTPIRDYIHVADLAEAHVLAIRRLIGGGDSGIYNVGTGEGATVMQIIAAAERALGKTVPYSVGPRRPGDPPSLVADSSRLKRDFGWAPKHSDLETIIRTAAEWQRTRPY